MTGGGLEARAVLVVGDGPVGRAVAARLAAVARVALGTTTPGASTETLAELDRVVALYARAEPVGLVVAADRVALVRCARRLLPAGHAVVLAEPPAIGDLEAVVGATAAGTVTVHLGRASTPRAPQREGLEGGRTLWRLGVEAASAWGGMRGATAAEVAVARVVRDLLFPLSTAA